MFGNVDIFLVGYDFKNMFEVFKVAERVMLSFCLYLLIWYINCCLIPAEAPLFAIISLEQLFYILEHSSACRSSRGCTIGLNVKTFSPQFDVINKFSFSNTSFAHLNTLLDFQELTM